MTSRFVLTAVIGSLVVSSFPSPVSAATQNMSLVFEIKTLQNINLSDTVPYFIPKEKPEPVVVEVIEPDPNIAILQNYLEQKGSPLAPYSEHLLKQENWKLVLAISNGESTLCKHQLYNNCWGIGGAWNLKRYPSYEDAITDVNQLLTEKYVARGADTPSKIVNRYVGHPNKNWVSAVNKVLTEVDQLPLED